MEMEKLNDLDQKSLIDELNQGRELANQLKNQMGAISTKEDCEELLQRILSSYDNALAVLNWTSLLIQDPSPIVGLTNSPQSFDDGISPKSNSANASSDDNSKNRFKKDSKKRKAMERWSEQVIIGKGTGLEGPPDDGHSWRKYGQKDILGAKYPRAYYRCSHRHTRGCLATKQIQRSDDDSSVLEVTYRGKHCCSRASSQTSSPDYSLGNQMEEKEEEKRVNKQLKTTNQNQENTVFPLFSFPSASSIEPIGTGIFWEAGEEDTTFLNSCHDFTSLACGFKILDSGRDQLGDYKCPSSEYELTDNSTPTSVHNSPFDLDMDISIEPSDFSLDCQEWFSQ